MRFSFCKNSVFCVIYFFLFFIGTICGVVLLRYALRSDIRWLNSYCLALRSAEPASIWLAAWFRFLPIMVLIAIYFLPHRNKLISLFILFQSCLCTYTVGMCFILDQPQFDVLVRNCLFFPVLYFVAQRLWITQCH